MRNGTAGIGLAQNLYTPATTMGQRIGVTFIVTWSKLATGFLIPDSRL